MISWVLLLACLLGGASSQAFTETSFYAQSFSVDTDDFFYRGGGATNHEDGYVSMTTTTTTNIAPVFWYETPVYIRGMSVNFTFTSTQDENENPGQGFVFLIQTESSETAGRAGPGLGYSNNAPNSYSGGITNSIAVEFDCVQDLDMNDPSAPHLSIHTRGVDKENSANEDWSVTSYPGLPLSVCNGAVNTVSLVYENGALTLHMDYTGAPLISSYDLDIESKIRLMDFGRAYIGFSASTGDFGADQNLISWGYQFLGILNAANTYALGDGLVTSVAGVEATFSVYSMDQYNNPFPFGGQDIQVSLDGPGDADVTVVYVVNGTYDVRYMVNVTGTYAITILANGVQIGTPAAPSTLITSAPAVASMSTNLDPVSSLVKASDAQTFRVSLHDQFGNQREVGGDNITAFFDPADPRDYAHIADNEDGTYTITWAAFVSQVGQVLYVTVDGLNIINSPFAFDVTPDDIHPPSCVLTNFSVNYEAGVRQTFQLLSRDAHGNVINVGGQNVSVSAIPAEPSTTFEVNDMGTGTYVISGFYEKAQPYEMSVLVNLQPAANSPYDVVNSPTILSIINCEAVGVGLTDALAGVQSQFTIITKDTYGNPLNGQVTTVFDVSLVGGPVTLKGTTVNNADGTVTARYTPTVSGVFSTSITASSVHIKNSPTNTNVSPTVESPSNTFIVGNNYTVLNGEFEHLTWFQVQVTDVYGNHIMIGGHAITVSLTTTEDGMLPIETAVLDNQNGSYTITYTPGENQAGMYTLSIYLSQQHIKDSPFIVEVEAESKKNAILLGVCLGLVGLCAVGLIGLVLYRRYSKRAQYTQLSSVR